ncbi:hypothetical protein BJ508DRAFT_370862 [Ascobolus immersus RN42]|uniref:Cell cycle control protein cwf19 n=1 Tax=Ascobolus immersus RN42 TaxID=1160509 RepID=A0A3N4HTS3_ASCIM|nr:hypothetical protein BJ508DRAFT_370862 [Ascobolus immersus RN42]
MASDEEGKSTRREEKEGGEEGGSRRRDREHREHRHHHRSSHRDSERRHRHRSRSRSKERSHRSRRDGEEKDKDREHRSSRDDKDKEHRSHRSSRDDRDRDRKRRHRDEDDSSRRHKSRRSEKDKDDTEMKDAPDSVELSPTRTSPKPTLRDAQNAWMNAPLETEYIRPKLVEKSEQPLPDPKPQFQISSREINEQLKQGKAVDDYETASVSYTFGDAGSKWRMMKLRRVYEEAKETGKSEDSVALERFGDLKSYDEAREEERELDRRELYNKPESDWIHKPTGDLYRERLAARKRRSPSPSPQTPHPIPQAPKPTTTILDKTALNRMQAAVLKAQLRGDPKAADLEAEYQKAMTDFANRTDSDVVVLSAMDSRLLAASSSAPKNEEDMTLTDMLREEKRTRGQGEASEFAKRIARDAAFTDNLDYMDENADKLAAHVKKKDINLKNVAVNDYKKMERILESCPLCQHEDRPSVAPVVSMGTRVYLTLPTEPELVKGGAVIVPIAHHKNTLECDDDEWEEIRNFMKSLIRLNHSKGQSTLFFESAVPHSHRRHAAITALPLPHDVAALAPAYFKEAILSAAPEWSQHKKLIDTLGKAKSGLGRGAFRRTMVKEMAYVHVWFELDGGVGHVVEDEGGWPRGERFVREVIAGMCDVDLEIWRKEGRWSSKDRSRIAGFKKDWEEFDWTKVLMEG